MTKRSLGKLILLELYRLVVVVWVFEKVKEKACRPRRFSMPKPMAGKERLLYPMKVKFSSNIGSTRPSLNPVRGTYSKSRDVRSVTRALAPKPNEAVCSPSRKSSAI